MTAICSVCYVILIADPVRNKLVRCWNHAFDSRYNAFPNEMSGFQARQCFRYESRRDRQNHVVAVFECFPDFGTYLHLAGVDLHVAEVAGIMTKLFDVVGVGLFTHPPLDRNVVFGQDFDERCGPASAPHHGYTG